jgi:hypothetical protein
VLVPCCHCIALRKHKLAKTTLYASHKLKSTGKRSAADGLTHEDELIEVGMGEVQNDDDEPFLFSLEECLRAITKRRRVLYCQAGRLVPIDNSARQRGRYVTYFLTSVHATRTRTPAHAHAPPHPHTLRCLI